MKVTLLALLMCRALAVGQNGIILSRETITFPKFSEAPSIQWYYDSAAYTTALEDKAVSIEKIFYRSDDLKVAAYVCTPTATSQQKKPVIIFNRGSMIRNDIGYVYVPMFKKLVHAGFIVIAPALRESEGSEGKDEVGGGDLHDITNVLSVLTHIPNADTSKMFMLGESRGGIMTYMVLKNKIPIKAAATVGAITNMEMYCKDNPWNEKALKELLPDYDKDRQQFFESRSVMNWAESISVPILIMNGQADTQVKPYHALNLAKKLSELGKVYQLVILEGGNHRLSGKQADERDRQIIQWFTKYLDEK